MTWQGNLACDADWNRLVKESKWQVAYVQDDKLDGDDFRYDPRSHELFLSAAAYRRVRRHQGTFVNVN